MNVLRLLLGVLVALAPGAPQQATAKAPAADTVTVTLVRWPFT